MAISRIHHLNCGTMCPVARRLVTGTGSLFERAHLVCHVLLVESDAGLILVDTGFGSRDVAEPTRVPRWFHKVIGPRLDVGETAAARIRALGLSPDDVRHIVVTHLDVDHAGGLHDFPAARIHVHALEHAAATGQATAADRARYLAHQWSHGPRWSTYADAGDRWLGFEAVRTLEGLDEDIALVPLVGHSSGHSGVAVRIPGTERWMLHAGDAYFFAGEVQSPPHCPLGLRLFQRLDGAGHRPRVANQARLRQLVRDHGAEVEVFCAHDPTEWDRQVRAGAVAHSARAAGSNP